MTAADDDNLDDDVAQSTMEPDEVYSEASDPFIGRVFNERFQVQQLIARGGLGAVYRAVQAPLGRTCAIKVLRPRYEETTPDEFHKRFFLEASIASRLTHPNNVTLYDYGHTEDDIYFMVMELLEGKTLAQTLRSDGPMNEERATHIGRQICRALREAHSLGVIHRDIKPANVFLTQKHDEPDFVKVMDFGLVKEINLQDDGLTKAGMFMGSPKYMSPEQIQGQPVDMRTDIYALGVVLFEMVTGRAPFNRKSSVEILIAHLNENAPALREAYPDCQISPHMEQVIYRCIAKHPDERFASTDELLVALKGFAGAAATATISTVSGSIPILGALSDSGPSFIGTRSGPHPYPAGGTTSDGLAASGLAASGHIERKSGPRWLMFAGIGAAAATALGIAAFVFTESRDPEPIAAALPPTTNALPSASPALSPPPVNPPPVSATPTAPPPVRISTTPDGALVRLGHGTGKKLCESTPCEIPRAELPDQGDINVYIVKRGYVIVTKKLERTADKLEVELIPAGGEPAADPDPKRPAEPNTYKIDPYG